jgi:hypothetical protein
VDFASAAVALVVGFGGVTIGGALSRRNDRRARAEALLVEALNDAVSAIAEVAGGVAGAQARYASATSRIALHAPPEVVQAFRQFQDDATTVSREGRRRLIAAVIETRKAIGHEPISPEDAHILLFGSQPVDRD